MIVRARLPLLFSTFLALVLSSVSWAQEGPAPRKETAYKIAAITVEQTTDDLGLRVQGNSPPTYTMYELFEPLRLVIDVADASLTETASLPTGVPQGPILQINSRVMSDQEPVITRIEIVLVEDRGYSVERQGNDILVAFANEVPGETPTSPHQSAGMATNSAQKTTAPAKVSGKTATALQDIRVDTSDPQVTKVFIKANGAITRFQKAQLKKSAGRPDRMYIDIPRVKLPSKALQQQVGTALARIRAAQRNGTARIVFDSGLNEPFAYDIQPRSDGLLVTVAAPAAAARLAATSQPAVLAAENTVPAVAETGIKELLLAAESAEELIKPIIPPSRAKTKTAAAEDRPAKGAKPAPAKKKSAKSATGQDAFGFAGYQKQKISVDFYKIDLHNVFRLFGEISGQNIVVDEAVSGSLTLALNDVPWDFALDIILNLKDLQKEERFNTIVIAPKAKQFAWPKAASEHVAFAAGGTGEKLEAISITQRIETPKGVVEAKELIREASELDNKGDYAAALPLYEQALTLWPENGQLASRMATICLVHLGMNAKAAHYAKTAFAAEPANHNAALQAAIALANMKKVEEAKRYFDKAISGDPPAPEALLSYAAFAEEYNSFNGAIALLLKHTELYGETVDSLVAKARLFDKKGDAAAAVEEYRTLLLSGYELPADLLQYIKGRIAAAENM